MSFVFLNADIDECSLAAVSGLQACQGDVLCINSPGSFTCSCPTGYIMAQNGQSCVGEDGVSGSCACDHGGQQGVLHRERTEGGNNALLFFSPQI